MADPASPFPSVIVTKVCPPHRRGDLIHRPRLVDALRAGLDRKLQVVHAPAGYGKTSLALDFVEQLGIATCWYRVEAAEADPTLFLEHVLASLRMRFPEACGETYRLLKHEGSRDLELLLSSLINEMALDIDGAFLLLLDDFHHVDQAIEVNHVLATIVDYLPSNAHLMILSRRRPEKLPLAHLAAAGELAGLGWEELCFTEDEIGVLMHELFGSALKEDEHRRLRDVSEGWAAALVMAGPRLLERAETDLQRFSTGTQALFDYLMRDVFEREPRELQYFLLATSIFDEMSPELCDVVFQRSDSAVMLRRLKSNNLFVEEVDTGVSWYRYHPLFHEFLSLQLSELLRQTDRPASAAAGALQGIGVDQGTLVLWHQRAAQWFAGAGSSDREVRHLLAAGQMERAAERMEAALGHLYADGRYADVVRMITAMPVSVLCAHPFLLHRLSGAYEATGQLDRAIAASNQAIACFEAAGRRSDLAEALVGRGTWHRLAGDIERAVVDTRRALTLAEDNDTRARGLRNLGQCQIAGGDLRAAEATFQEALSCALRDGDARVIAHTHTDLSMLYQMMGDVDRGLDHALSAAGYWRELDRPGGLSLALNNLGTAYHLRGLRREAEIELREAVRQARLAGIKRIEGLALIGLADLAADRDDFAIAESLYDRGVRLAREGRIVSLQVYGLAMWAETLRLKGDLKQAFQLLMEARTLLMRRPSAFEEALVSQARGTLALDRGELARAARHLDDAATRFEALGCRRETARALLYRGVVSERMHHRAEADRSWDLAQSQIQQHGYEGAFEVDLARIARYRGTGIRETGQDATWDTRMPADLLSGASVDALWASIGQPPADTALMVLALGPPLVIRDGRPVDQRLWETMTARDLFFYLIERHGGATSDELMLMFWPDSSPKRAKSALHSTLSRIRRALGKTVIGVSANRYFVSRSGALVYDVEGFATAVRRARAADDVQAAIASLDAAVGLVRGEYLDGVLSDWCIERRWGVEREVTQAMLALADAHMQAGHWTAAAATYQRVVERDILGEVAYQGLMRALAAQGDRASALRVYDGLEKLLARELGVDPDPQTRALCGLIRAGRA